MSDPTRVPEGWSDALTPEAERQLRRDIEQGGPVTPGDLILLLNTLDAARSALSTTPAPELTLCFQPGCTEPGHVNVETARALRAALEGAPHE